MGLKTDIKNALLGSAGFIEALKPSNDPKKNIEDQADKISKAIIKFIQAQEFKVVQMSSELDVESITTSGPLTGDISMLVMGKIDPSTVSVPDIPVQTNPTSGTGTTVHTPVSKKLAVSDKMGVKVPTTPNVIQTHPLQLKKGGGQEMTGQLSVTGVGLIDDPDGENDSENYGIVRLTEIAEGSDE